MDLLRLFFPWRRSGSRRRLFYRPGAAKRRHLRIAVGVEGVGVDVLVVALAGDPAHEAAVAVEDDALFRAYMGSGHLIFACFVLNDGFLYLKSRELVDSR